MQLPKRSTLHLSVTILRARVAVTASRFLFSQEGTPYGIARMSFHIKMNRLQFLKRR